uniref:Beta-galactosidase n=1 Tax=Octopus bimaculoides TaxID=37653 RepID=A0A0L8HG67_OCTBM
MPTSSPSLDTKLSLRRLIGASESEIVMAPVPSIAFLALVSVAYYYGFTLYRHQLESSVYQKPLIGLDVRDRAYVSVNQLGHESYFFIQATTLPSPRSSLNTLLLILIFVAIACQWLERQEHENKENKNLKKEFMGILEWQWTYVMNITGKAGDFLNILVENQAHITFGNTINNNLKGILKNLTLNNQTLSKWEMYPFYDMQSPNKTVVESFLKKATEKSNATSLKIPTFYHGLINLPNDKSQVNDTYIDLKYWTKGQVYINGFNLGRYWTARGPQIRLFVPKTVLVPGVNNVVLFELESAPCGEGNPCIVTFVDTPLINSATISSRVVSQQRTLH